MPQLTCEREGVTAVLLGNFNPAIFQPSWLAARGLITLSEAEAAKVDVVSGELSAFSVDWLTIQVTADRFQAVSADVAHSEPLRDMVVGIFTILEHTPLTSLGINRQMHYRVPSEASWHEFGHLLAPKAAWSGILSAPGLRTLIIEGTRAESPAKMRLKVEPSVKVHPGVYIEVNEHHEAPTGSSPKLLVDTMRRSWEQAQAYAKRAAEHLLSQRTWES